jgi:hypothetical protein
MPDREYLTVLCRLRRKKSGSYSWESMLNIVN